jgi:hypothetical protein
MAKISQKRANNNRLTSILKKNLRLWPALSQE